MPSARNLVRKARGLMPSTAAVWSRVRFMALSSGGDQFANAVKQCFRVGQCLINLRQTAGLFWWRGSRRLNSAVRNVLDEIPQVQVIGPI
ncbi:hypothetical protein D3C84_1169790 [compost metagenome]